MAIEFENRLVAYVDILGWSNATETMSAADLYGILEPLRLRGLSHNETHRQQLVSKFGANVNPLMLEIQYTFFSDCFVFSMPTSMGARIYDAISEIMREFLKSGFAVRGGITAGKLFHHDQVAFGPALLAAHRIENEQANFARVMVDENAIRATGIKQDFAIIKDHLGNWIIDPFPRIATSSDMRDLIQQFFEPQHTLKIIDQKITGYASQSRIRDIWRFQAEVCALSLEKYGGIANDWVTDFRAIAEIKTTQVKPTP